VAKTPDKIEYSFTIKKSTLRKAGIERNFLQFNQNHRTAMKLLNERPSISSL
jgi:hypothetical protein